MKVRIQIVRAEGPNDQCGKRLEFSTFKEVNQCLKNWSDTAPAKGGHDKCDFRIFSDEPAMDYTGRYDLVHWSKQMPDLKEHVNSWLKHVMSSERYSDTAKKSAKELLDALAGAE